MNSFRSLYIKTVIILFILFMVAFVVPFHYLLDDFATGIGVGAMSAVWGAPGFGAIAAAGIWDLRKQDQKDD